MKSRASGLVSQSNINDSSKMSTNNQSVTHTQTNTKGGHTNILPETSSSSSESSLMSLETTIDVASIDIFSLARHGRFQQLKQVLDLGVDPNSKDKYGNTLAIIGAQNGNKAIVKLALRYGGHLNMTNILGNTALHYCSEFGYVELAEYLMSKGASTDITNMRGFKPLDGIKPARGKYETT